MNGDPTPIIYTIVPEKRSSLWTIVIDINCTYDFQSVKKVQKMQSSSSSRNNTYLGGVDIAFNPDELDLESCGSTFFWTQTREKLNFWTRAPLGPDKS